MTAQRTLSPAAARAVLARETDEVFLTRLTLAGEGSETIRIVNNTEPVVSAAGTFRPYPFEAVLPEDTDAASPQVQVRVCNVSREFGEAVRTYVGVPRVTMDVVLASDPDHVEVGPFNFVAKSGRGDAIDVNVTLGYEEDFLNQSVPAQRYLPSTSPGLFRR